MAARRAGSAFHLLAEVYAVRALFSCVQRRRWQRIGLFRPRPASAWRGSGALANQNAVSGIVGRKSYAAVASLSRRSGPAAKSAAGQAVAAENALGETAPPCLLLHAAEQAESARRRCGRRGNTGAGRKRACRSQRSPFFRLPLRCACNPFKPCCCFSRKNAMRRRWQYYTYRRSKRSVSCARCCANFFKLDAFIKMGDKSSADHHLRRVYELITVLEADYYRKGADLCVARIEQMP